MSHLLCLGIGVPTPLLVGRPLLLRGQRLRHAHRGRSGCGRIKICLFGRVTTERERERGDIREIVGVWVWYLYTFRLHWLVSFLPFVLLSQTFQSHLSDCVGRERTIHQAFSINIHNSVICVNFGVWFC